jgi:hypothetical protein
MSALIDGAEAIVDNYVGQGLEENATYYEEREYPANTWNQNIKYGREIYLSGINPHGTLKIDNVTISSSDYRIKGQKLTLKNTITFKTDFPFLNKYEYSKGFSVIPNAIKQACYIIVSELNGTKNGGGISSFRQDLLSVNFDKSSMLSSILSQDKVNDVALLLNPYKGIDIVTSGIDRSTVPWLY